MAQLPHVGSTLSLAGITLGAAAGLASVGALATFRRSLPRTSGTLSLPGLQAPVTIMRDRWGVPHIYATNNHDLFAALGFVHAQDRLWQMEVNRATGLGQVATIVGSDGLDTDRFVRTVGLHRAAAADYALLDDATHTLAAAYVAGVNAFLTTHEHRLPIEFGILRYTPRPWEVLDLLAWLKVVAFALSTNWAYELLNAHLAAALGAERAHTMLLHYPADQPFTVPADVLGNVGIGAIATDLPRHPTGRNGRTRNSSAPLGGHPGEGSNAWVVSGQRTHSGAPLLANDPHLAASLPLVWYEAHLHGGDYHVTGVTFPGLPGVVIGHNEHIAWGITNGMVDVQDLFIERFDPANPLRYRWQGGWRDAELHREEIHIRGHATPHIEEVRITHHGPIITRVTSPTAAAPDSTPPLPLLPNDGLALCWAGHTPGTTLRAGLALNRARNWDEFRAVMDDWGSPVQNVVYADVAGHYGYVLAGKMPLRRKGEGRLPVPGWTGEYDWNGYIPAAALPATLDPPVGYVVSANNRVTSPSHPYHHAIQGEWLNGYRAQRISDLLTHQPKHDIASFATIQLDVYSIPGAALARLVADLPLSDPAEQPAQMLLRGWDGTLDAESAAGAVYTLLRYHLERLAYAAMGDLRYQSAGIGLLQTLPGAEGLSRRSLPGILARIAAAPLPDRPDEWLGYDSDGTPRTWNSVLHTALSHAVADLHERCGHDPKHWKYGKIHSLTLRHVLGRVPLLAPIFNRGNWQTGGDLDTVNVGYLTPDRDQPAYVAPLYRQICDPSDWDASVSILISGQSGHPASRHYTDMTALWQRGEYHPMLWSRARVEEHAVATLQLEPATHDSDDA